MRAQVGNDHDQYLRYGAASCHRELLRQASLQVLCKASLDARAPWAMGQSDLYKLWIDQSDAANSREFSPQQLVSNSWDL